MIRSSPAGFKQYKAIATDSGHLRFAYAQHHCTSNRRIDSISARLQRINRDFRRQRMRRRAHAIVGKNRRAARKLKIAHVLPQKTPVKGTA